MVTKQRIKKNTTETATAAAGDAFELSNITVEEVSLVDRPANQRTFLVKKKRGNKTEKSSETTPATEPVVAASAGQDVEDLAAAPLTGGTNLAAELDAKDGPANKAAADLAALDAADKGTSAAVVAPAETVKSETPPVTPAALSPVDATTAIAALADEVKKTEVTVTPESDGSITVAVETAPEITPAAPQEVIDKVKAAVLAGIDAVASRLIAFRGKVEADDSGSPWNMSGRPYLGDDICYLQDMLWALCDIGGPGWEIEAAGDEAMNKSADKIKKAHRGIMGSRIAKLGAVHKGLSYCMKDFESLMKELQDETEEKADDVTKAAPAPAVAVAVSAATVPTVPESVLKDIIDLRASVTKCQEIIKSQAAELQKRGNTVQESNAIAAPQGNDAKRDMIAWPSDLAVPSVRYSR